VGKESYPDASEEEQHLGVPWNILKTIR